MCPRAGHEASGICSPDSSSNAPKAAIARGLCGLTDNAELLGCHFFGFAFLPHEFQFALGFLEGGRDFLLHAGSGFFEFLRKLDVAVVLHARSGWDEASDDDVFLEAAQAVHRTVDAGFGEYTRGVLE